MITSLSVPAQKAAEEGMANNGDELVGAVVAIQPSTGRVVAMYSSPSFNPNRVAQNFARLDRRGGAPLLNRATQGLYAPGSTFKIVTATAALQSGKYTPTEPLIDAHGHCIIDEGHELCNAGTESYGAIDLTEALTFSVNTVFAQIGEQVGQTRLEDVMRRFGFFQLPPFTYPTDEMAPSGLYSNGRLLAPTPRSTSAGWPSARSGSASRRCRWPRWSRPWPTAASGWLRALWTRSVTPSGHTIYTGRPQEIERVMSTQTAAELTAMMKDVVDEGTGTAANVLGLNVAGKTGTAETGTAGSEHRMVRRTRPRRRTRRSPWRSSWSTRPSSAARSRRRSPPR